MACCVLLVVSIAKRVFVVMHVCSAGGRRGWLLVICAVLASGIDARALAADPVATKDGKPVEKSAEASASSSGGAAAPSPVEAPAFRTDGGDEKLPWYQLKPAEFPPEGSAHYIAGELISVDHVNRTGVLRPDRTDAQRRGDWDLPHAFTLLPFGSVSYHGAPADLRDIPLGTHLHGQFYLDDAAFKKKDPKAKPPSNPPRVSTEAQFNRCLRLEDDLSYMLRKDRVWRIDEVNLETGVLTVMGLTAGKPDAKPTILHVVPSTRVYKQRGFGSLADLAAGQTIWANLTIATIKGPGRCVSIWLDPESRDLATAHQLEVHRQHHKEHGFAGWIDHVDNQQSLVSMVLFAGFEPKLAEDFVKNESCTAAVAEENLRTWDQINDRKGGTVTNIEQVEMSPGNSGIRITFKASLLLEGFRPGRVIRLWPGKWKVDDLPREEKLYN